jgi:uncharacterized Fe-S center protein
MIFIDQGAATNVKNKATLIREEKALAGFLKRSFESLFRKGESIAVKVHMGEPGNAYYIKPELTSLICDALSERGCDPFVFDTPVVYSSPRDSVSGYAKSAAAHGYSKESIGYPIVISDEGTELKGSIMDYEVADVLMRADGVVLLSHVKGHIACGMGGAIKNVGMGCMTKKTKGMIHTGGEPIYDKGCVQCGECVEACPTSNIRISDERPYFDRTWCAGCSNCAVICPEECIRPKKALFDELLAEAASIAHEHFSKVYAVNVLMNISKLCDCMAASGPIIVEDIGFICGEDMFSVDAASLETIASVSGKEDIFAEHNIRSPWNHVHAAGRFLNRDASVIVKEIGRG